MQGKIWEKGMGSGSKLLRKELFLMWWEAAKPANFMATLIPLTLAFIAAGIYKGIWGGLVFAGVLLVAFALHMCASLCYHLFGERDGERGRAHSRQQLKDVFTTKFVLQIVVGLYALVLLITVITVWLTGLNPLLFFVLFAMFSSFFFVAPPISLGRQGIGEILVFLNLGLVAVCGTFYALTRDFPLYTLALAIPVGSMIAMVIFYRSIIGIRKDILTGRKTLATFLGPEKSAFLFTIAWPGIWLLLLMLWFCGLCCWQVTFGIILSLPFYVKLVADLNDLDDPESGEGLSKYFTYFMYLICGISLIVAVAYTGIPQKATTITPPPPEVQTITPEQTIAPAPAPPEVETVTPPPAEVPVETAVPEAPVENLPE